MADSAPSRKKRSPHRRGFLYLAILIGSLLLFFLLSKFLSYWQDRQNLAEIQRILAEQDAKQPGWRWGQFQPEPLKMGYQNGALRFLEAGRLITTKMVEAPIDPNDAPDETTYQFPNGTMEHLTHIEFDAYRRDKRIICQQCQPVEKYLPNLIGFKAGCPPLAKNWPTTEAAGLSAEGLADETQSLKNCYQWLISRFYHHLYDGTAHEAVLSLRANIARSNCMLPGLRLGYSNRRSVQYFVNYRMLQKLLGIQELSDSDLIDLQNDVRLMKNDMLRLDDIRIDRAFFHQQYIALLGDDTAKELLYLKRNYQEVPSWLPKRFEEHYIAWGLGVPSHASMILRETQSVKNWFDHLEKNHTSLTPMWDFDFDRLIPGKDFQNHFISSYRMMLSNLVSSYSELGCMDAILAAERYRVKHQKMPNKWSDLVPEFLPAIPTDNDQPYILKQVEHGLAIYVIGFSGKDLGGKIYHPYDYENEEMKHGDVDRGLILFHPKLRGQPLKKKPEAK